MTGRGREVRIGEGFDSFLKRWKKSNSQRKPTTAKRSPFTRSESSIAEMEGAHRLQPIPRADSSSCTQQQSYARELEAVFRRFDANGDGKVTWAELGWIMSNLGKQETPEELQRMIQEVDSDGDGCISLDEFIQLNTNGDDYGAALEDIRNAFFLYDVNGDGFISCEELHRFLSKLGDSSTMDECRWMIAGVDRNGDGRINFEEFKLMMMGRSSQFSA